MSAADVAWAGGHRQCSYQGDVTAFAWTGEKKGAQISLQSSLSQKEARQCSGREPVALADVSDAGLGPRSFLVFICRMRSLSSHTVNQ